MRRIMAILFTVLIPLTGCQQLSNERSGFQFDTQTMRVAVILPHSDFGYWTLVADGIDIVREKYPVDIKIYMPQLNYNVEQMVDLIHQVSAAKVDAIVVQGIDNEAYLNALENARIKGSLIVFIDTDVPEFDVHLYVGTDNYEAGQLMGERLIDITNGSAKIAVILGAKGYPNIELRLKGLKDAISGYENINIKRVEYNNFDTLTVVSIYNMILKEEPLINTIVCLEGTSGQALGTVLQSKEASIKNILTFDLGDDTIVGLDNGVIDGLVVQRPTEMGERVIRELYLYNQTGSYSDNIIHTSISFVTKDDVSELGQYEAY